jgi:hypothetical protein
MKIKMAPPMRGHFLKTFTGYLLFTHCPCRQHWAHLAPVQFFGHCVQTCRFAVAGLPPAYAAEPANIKAVAAKRNTFLI